MAKFDYTQELKLFRKEELLEKYKELTEEHQKKLRVMIKKTLVPFVAIKIITDVEKKTWEEEDYECKKEERYDRLIGRVQESKSLDVFLRFTRALTYRNNKAEIIQVYDFFPHLFEVGLVDPLQGQGKFP